MGCGLIRSTTEQRPRLTPRQVEVLREWLRTDSKAEAADRLFISTATVSTHVNRIRRQYVAVGRPAPTKAMLAIRALQDDYVTVDEL